ncbi:metallophosphoesterase [Aquamicrobium sp. LC103]|uniref:metallophosphoesterase family protein n=1 Tax=Aquamicrobium sp. LC103 TaxID=1120658 RepID=UPI00063E9CF2|nr:metallophosphoesterase [Aquamicrobium sp. LC103]TKT69087.1 metallophosphoesterase [Aquamicrobium sp. LC103]
MKPLIDPRHGDIEDDASSPKKRSLVSIAGNMLIEVSLLKLALAWALLLVIPGLVLGLFPIAAGIWLRTATDQVLSLSDGLVPLAFLLAIVAVGWYGGRALLRAAEHSFWTLAATIVEPVYGACREGLRQMTERFLPKGASVEARAKLRSVAAAAAGLLVSALALCILYAIWPRTHVFGLGEAFSFQHLAGVALANSLAMICAYLAVGALIWAFADATMSQPRGLESFDTAPQSVRRWRVVHLSDIHVVGERYGFRIESGRAGPRGNDRLRRLLDRLEEVDREARLDHILITGDITDAGRSSEWAEFLSAVEAHPALADRILIIPGNHDLNIVDRANPARLDLPTSPNPRLRQLRMLSAMAALQGRRVQLVERGTGAIDRQLAAAMEPHRGEIERFADVARPLLSRRLGEVWNGAFPMVVPPDGEQGLGIVLFNSNADTHFSFTNALGLVSAEQVLAFEEVAEAFPRACWLVVLHHHAIEYPLAVSKLSERIGTALINGNWFLRRMKRFAGRAVLMHGHRHFDWIGRCEGLLIVSAPSPVMGVTDDLPTAFYVHTLAISDDGRLKLLKPQRIELPGDSG